VRLCESRCGDRQEQEGKRLPALALIELELGWGLAEVSALAGFAVLLPGGGPRVAGAMYGAFVGSPRVARMRMIDLLWV